MGSIAKTFAVGLGDSSDSSDSMTIIIISVTITTVIVETTILIVDMWFQACVFNNVLSQHTHNHVTNTCEDGKEYF